MLAAIDAAADVSNSAAISSLSSLEAEKFIVESKGKGNRLYSHLSKGVHWEFFTSAMVSFDEETVQTLLQDSLVWLAKLAFVSHFIPTAHCNLSSASALRCYSDVWGWINA